MSRLACCLLIAACWLAPLPRATAQQQTVTVGSTGVSDSFYEGIGVGWGVRQFGPGGGFFFNNGGPGPAPAFGGFDPGTGASFGFGGNGFGMNFGAAQGSSRSIVSQSGSVTVANGAGGFISSGSVRPFVTGVIPVVGGAPQVTLTSPLELKLQQLRSEGAQPRAADSSGDAQAPSDASGEPSLQLGSSAARPASSLSEIRQQQAAEDQRQRSEAWSLIQKGKRAEQAGKIPLARNYYVLALRRLDPDHPWTAAVNQRIGGLPSNQ